MNPFVGLRPFEADEAHLFFGRETQIATLLERLRQRRFVAVVGPSGSGKSSLVRAGLLPAMHRDFVHSWRVAVMRPGSEPVANLSIALSDPDTEDDDVLLESTLRRGSRGLIEAVHNMRSRRLLEDHDRLVVLVDQFEELFRYETAAEASAFVKLLLEAVAEPGLPLHVILTMRSEFLGECGMFPGLSEALEGSQFLIPRMTRDERRRAIEDPVKVVGGHLGPGLVNRLLNDGGDEPDVLPLLQHALMRLWEESPDLGGYERVGGLTGALDQHLEGILESLTPEGRTLARRLFQRLTEARADGRELRAPARFSDLVAVGGRSAAETLEVLDRFREHSFLLPDGPLRPDTVVDLSHESLMRGWSRLKGWIRDERESARVLRRLVRDARSWREGQKDLLREPELSLVERWRQEQEPSPAWAARYGGGLDEALEYLAESRRAHDREEAERLRAQGEREEALTLAARAAEQAAEAQKLLAEEARRTAQTQAKVAEIARLREAEQLQAARKLRALVAMLGIALLAAVALGVRSWRDHGTAMAQKAAAERAGVESRRALDSARHAKARQLASQARVAGDAVRPQRALLLAAAAASLRQAGEEDFPPGPRWSLWEARADMVGRGVADVGEPTGAEVAPDGKLVAWSDDTRIGLKDLDNLDGEPRYLWGHDSFISSVSFSPDGKRLVTGASDHTIRLWDLETGETLRVLRGHRMSVTRVTFTRAGDRVVSASEDGTVRIWDPDTGESLLTLTGIAPFTALAVTPDGHRVFAGAQDGLILTWDLRDPSKSAALWSHEYQVGALAVSPDGAWLASGAYDATLRLWDLRSGVPEKPTWIRTDHRNTVQAVRFSPDGKRLVTGSWDRTARIWDLDQPQASPLIVPGHDQFVMSACWALEGRAVVTASLDGTVRLCAIQDGISSADFGIAGPQGLITALRVSRGGRWAAGAWDDGSVRLWRRSADGALEEAAVLQADAEPGPVDLAFSPDDRHLATAGGDGVKVWSLARPSEPVWKKEDLEEGPISVSFSADGKWLAWGSEEGHVTLRQVASGREQTLSGTQVAFSPGGRWLATGTDEGAIEVRDLRSTTPFATWKRLKEHTRPILCLAFSADERYLASGSEDASARVWDLQAEEPGAEFDPMRHGSGEVYAVAFMGSAALATASGDGTARLWDLTRPEESPQWLQLHWLSGGEMTALACAPDGSQVLAGGDDGIVRSWRMAPSHLVKDARRLTGRDFRQGELEGFGLATWARMALDAESPGPPGPLTYLAETLLLDPKGDREIATEALRRAGDTGAAAVLLDAPQDLSGLSARVLERVCSLVLMAPGAPEPLLDLGGRASLELVRREPQSAAALAAVRGLYLARGRLSEAVRLLPQTPVAPALREAETVGELLGSQAPDPQVRAWLQGLLARLEAAPSLDAFDRTRLDTLRKRWGAP